MTELERIKINVAVIIKNMLSKELIAWSKGRVEIQR